MDKRKLSEKLGVRVDSLDKALSRLGITGVDANTIPQIVAYYANPAPRRDPATVAAAQELLGQFNGQQNNIIVFNDNRSVSGPVVEVLEPSHVEPQEQTKQESEAEEPVQAGSFSLSSLLANREVLAALVLVGAVAMAKAITAPIFMSVGVAAVWSYILSFYIDLAGFVFVWHQRHTHGKLFAINTALQTALTVGALNWMGTEIVMIAKGISVSACLGIAVHGFSSIIAQK